MGNGIPPLAEDFVIDAVQLLTEDLVSSGTQQQQWGLFDQNGDAVVTAESVVSFESKQEYRISDYQVEEGAFETYNKVATPYDVRLRFSQGGTISDRQAVQAQVDAVLASTDLFDAVTPTKVYQSINPLRQSVRHTATDGVGLLIIDLYCEQVRVTATTQFTNSSSTNTTTSGTSLTPNQVVANDFADINQPQSPSASPQVAGGTVQATTPTAAQQTEINGLLINPAGGG